MAQAQHSRQKGNSMHRGSEAPEKRDREEIESDEGGARENKTLPKFLDIRPSEEDKGRRER